MRQLSRDELGLLIRFSGGRQGSNPSDEEPPFSGEPFRTWEEPTEGYWWLAVLYEDGTGGVAGPFDNSWDAREAEDGVWSGTKRVQFTHYWISEYPDSRRAFLAEFHR